MSAQMGIRSPTRSRWRPKLPIPPVPLPLLTAPLLALSLLACSRSPQPTPGPATTRVDALVIGPVSSAYLEPLKSTLNLVTYDGSQKHDDYELIVFDGDAHTSAAVAAHPLLTQALSAGKWVLGVDLNESHKTVGLGPSLHASTCGQSAAYAVRLGADTNGRFQARVIEGSRSQTLPNHPAVSGPTSARVPAGSPPAPGKPSCGGGPGASAQNLNVTREGTQAFAKTLLAGMAQPALTPQDAPTIPADLLYATYYFTETFSQPISGSLQGHPGTQTPNYTVNRTFTVYLNNKNNPQGDFQYVLLEQDAAANPKLASEDFIAMGKKYDTDWALGTYDDAGWGQNQMQLSLSANPTDWTLVSTSPDTVNGITSVTTGVSFQVQFGANPDGPNGSGSFTYSNSQTRDISDWKVNNLATNTGTQWMYESNYPVDADYIPNCSAAIRGTGCYLGQLPNALAQDALKLYTQSVWKTPSVVDGTAGFSYWTYYQLLDVGCNNNGGLICAASGNDGLAAYKSFQPQYLQELSFDLGVVVPIPIASITFSPNPVEGGAAVTGTVTLTRPAKIDTSIALSSNSQNATVLPTVTVKQGQTEATFQVLTNTNGIATGASSVATIQAFYAQNYQAQLTVQNVNNASLSLAPASVEPGQVSVGTVGLSGPAAVDTVVPLTSTSPYATVPASVTVKAGQSTATFDVSTNAGTLAYGASTNVILSAGTAQAQLTVTRVGLASLAFTPPTLLLGQQATGTVTRATPAPIDTAIPLSSGNVRAGVPTTVTIPKGQTSATFPVTSSVLGPDSRGFAAISAANLQTRLLLSKFVGISVGGGHACALKVGGTVVCWGYNGVGQTNVPAGLSGVTQIRAGSQSTCALKADGTVVCWGNVNPPGSLLSGPFALFSGLGSLCGMGSDGSVTCWSSPIYPATLNPPTGLADISQLSAGLMHACALKGNGSVACWGYDFGGETVIPAGLTGALQVSAGGEYTCVLKGDSTVACYGLVLTGGTDVPAGLSGVTEVSTGFGGACALKGDGTVVCWGLNDSGQLNVPAGLSGVVQVSAGGDGNCAIRNDGTVVCWGNNKYGLVSPPTGLNLLKP